MIHYDKIAELAAKGPVKLKVNGMLPLGRYRQGHEKEGEPIPPAIANGTIVTVVDVDVDSVTVETPDGKEVVFAHAKGAEKLEIVAAKEEPAGAPEGGASGERDE